MNSLSVCFWCEASQHWSFSILISYYDNWITNHSRTSNLFKNIFSIFTIFFSFYKTNMYLNQFMQDWNLMKNDLHCWLRQLTSFSLIILQKGGNRTFCTWKSNIKNWWNLHVPQIILLSKIHQSTQLHKLHKPPTIK